MDTNTDHFTLIALRMSREKEIREEFHQCVSYVLLKLNSLVLGSSPSKDQHLFILVKLFQWTVLFFPFNNVTYVIASSEAWMVNDGLKLEFLHFSSIAIFVDYNIHVYIFFVGGGGHCSNSNNNYSVLVKQQL